MENGWPVNDAYLNPLISVWILGILVAIQGPDINQAYAFEDLTKNECTSWFSWISHQTLVPRQSLFKTEK